MKRISIILIVLLFCIGLITPCSHSQEQGQRQGPAVGGYAHLQRLEIPFTGKWQITDDPLLIDENSFSDITNMQYTDKSVKGVNGYSKVNTAPFYLGYNYSDFTETDVPTRVTVADYVITVADLDTDEDVYVYYDEGAAFFSADFEHELDFECTDSGGICGAWSLSNGVDDLTGLAGGDTDHLALYLRDLYDYTASVWTETDVPTRVTVAEDTITVADLDTDEDVYVHRDMGAAHFDADFEHRLAFKCTASTSGACGLWTVSNDDPANGNGLFGLADNDLDHLSLRWEDISYNSDIKLLVNCDGADESQSFTDKSGSGHTITAQGNSQVDTAQKKFGTGSAYSFDGGGVDHLSIPDHADWFMDTSDFAIAGWIRIETAAWHSIFEQFEDGQNEAEFAYDHRNAKLRFVIKVANNIVVWVQKSVSLSLNTWYHVAAIRGWGGNANDWAVTVNGVPGSTTTDASAWPNFAGSLRIGKTITGAKGWIDELCVWKGITPWTSDFSASLPSMPYEGYLVLQETNGVTDTTDESIDLNTNIDYYITPKRTESVGTYGTLYAYIYSDSARSTLVDTLTVTLTEKQDFQYLFGMISYDSATGGSDWDGTISNLGNHPWFVLRETNGAVDTEVESALFSVDTDYYLTIERDESEGTFGELYCSIYSDSDRDTLVETLTVTLTEKQDFRYVFGMISWDDATTTNTWDGTIANLTTDPYDDLLSGYHFKKDQPSETHVLVQAQNSAGAKRIFQSKTAIPDQGTFEETSLYTDSTGAGRGRFVSAPQGNVVYSNGVESLIWGGDEMRCAAFILSTAAITNTVTNARDFTEQIQNALTASDEIAVIANPYLYGVIGSTRPLQGVKFYVKTANTQDPSTLTFDQWNGAAWDGIAISDNTKPGTISLATTGTVTWTDTDGTSKPKYLEGRVLYWYRWAITAASTAEISHVTVDAAFQTTKNVWSGDPSTVASCQKFDGADFQAYTIEVNDAITTSVLDLGGLVTASEYVLLGFLKPQQGLEVFIPPGKGNSVAAVLTVSYWDGDSWATRTAAAGTLSDGTIDSGASLGKPGVIFFTSPTRGTEFPTTIGQEGPYYYYKLTWGATLSGYLSVANRIAFGDATNLITDSGNGLVTAGFSSDADLKVSGSDSNDGTYTIETVVAGTLTLSTATSLTLEAADATTITLKSAERVAAYYISGIENPAKIPAHKFAVDFQTRTLLCSPDEAPAAVLVSKENAPDVFNGDDSTTLYFGGDDDLVTGIGLYNRHGASIYNYAVLCKRSETWTLNGYNPETFEKFQVSGTIGCVAPLTMDAFEIGHKKGVGGRNVVAWLDYSGLVMFDGTVIASIPGMEPYFDPSDDRCVNYDAIEDSHGFADPLLKHYNLFIPSGSGQTTPNVWLVYDWVRNKWFKKEPPMYPQCSFRAGDTDGAQYGFIGFSDGYIRHNENGTTFDDTAISQSLTLRDLLLTKSMWDITQIDFIKLICDAKNSGNQVDITLKHRADGSETWDTLSSAIPMYSTGNRYADFRLRPNVRGVSHELQLSCSTNDKADGFEPIALGILYKAIRTDTTLD